jgi:hypothetical protein
LAFNQDDIERLAAAYAHDPRRQAWDGRWPGEADCERLGFFVNGDRSLPDINRSSEQT